MNRKSFCAFAMLSLLLCQGTQAHARTQAITYGDVELLGNLQLAADSTLSDGVLLIVHGTLAHHAMELMANLQTLLAERGYNTLAITLSLGQTSRRGMYDCALPHTHRHQDAVAEIGRWMDWLQEQGAGPVLLAGHSRGGNQVARYAVANASRLRAVVLIAPATYDRERSSAAYQKRYAVPLAEVIAKAQAASAKQSLDGVGFLYCQSARVTAEAFLSYYVDDAMHDTPALLPKIARPTLVIAGGADQVVSDVPLRAKAYLDDDRKLLVIDDAGHFFQDLFAEDLADAIAGFAAQQLP
jgi:pimeloyl-ACP methyl ester carboxylesterase